MSAPIIGRFHGMKVHTINPGSVGVERGASCYYYTIVVNGRVYRSEETHGSAAGAKDAMRLKVRTLRRQHGIAE